MCCSSIQFNSSRYQLRSHPGYKVPTLRRSVLPGRYHCCSLEVHLKCLRCPQVRVTLESVCEVSLTTPITTTSSARNTKVQFEALTLTCQQEEQRRRLQHDGTLRGKLSQRETPSSPQHSHHPQSPVQQTVFTM